MSSGIRLVALGLAAGLLASAQFEVGTVTSTSPFRLRGAAITPGEGVPSWPVMPGDTIKAGDAVTIVTFTDGSVLSLEPGAEGNFDAAGATPSFQLANGTVVYSLKSKTSVRLFSGDKAVNPPNLTGSYSRNGQRPSGGFWTPAHTAIVGGAAAGAATGVALGVAESNSSGSQVSPTH